MASAQRDIEAGGGAPDYRLKSRKLINHLFTRGPGKDRTRRSIAHGPVLVSFDIVGRPEGVLPRFQAGVTTNRRIQRAVDRNRIKRALREAIASRREDLLAINLQPEQLLIFMIVFRASTPASPAVCREAAQNVILKMIADFEQNQPTTGTT